MPSKLKNLPVPCLLVLLLAAGARPLAAAELMTLFTTPQERQLINSNRYKSAEPRPAPVAAEPVRETPVQQLVREEVTREYRISGITLSSEGPHTVWINSIAYQDGERLDDTSRVSVLAGDEIRVRITAPDGKNYFATSGQTLEITYLAPIEN